MFTKIWALITAKLLTVKTFDLCLQGSLLLIILLEHNCLLLLARTSDTFTISMIMGDYATMGVGGLEFLAGSFIAWLGKGKRQLALSFWFTVTAAFGLIVIAFPFVNENAPLAELCDFIPLPELSGFSTGMDQMTASTFRTVFLITTLALCALAKISIWAHGFTYLDDRAPQDGAYFYGILISIQLSLGLSGKTWLRSSANLEDWQVPQICLCSLIIMFAVLFQLYPRNDHKEDYEYDEMNDDDVYAVTSTCECRKATASVRKSTAGDLVLRRTGKKLSKGCFFPPVLYTESSN
ncbi:hypothetical protein evm_002688 [Chilo suppressalis]|nr:hypothetical protein evm_002688 [Chilo suppressalis]